MRADKYDSPEHKRALDRLRTKFEENPENSDKEFKVPRMIQNPNFDEILRFLKEIRTQKRKQDLTNLANFINELPLPLVEEYKQPTTIIYDYENLNANKDKLDPRFCFSLTDFLTYLNNFWIEK
jgi:phage/plasmid-associated DNA primase